MLSYEIFKGILVDNIKKYLPKEYQDFPLEVRKYEKVNMVVEALSFNITTPTPGISINEVY